MAWLITGCSSGFGKELVDQLLKNGEKVVVTARNTEDIQEYRANDHALVLTLDVTKEGEIKTAVEKATNWEPIDILVNNAGYGVTGTIEEIEKDDVRANFETNVFGLLNVTKEVIPHMKKRNSGLIINLSSIAGIRAAPGLGIYCATKFSVEAISEALSQELAEHNIKVMIVEPGPFRTRFSDNATMTDSQYESTAPVNERIKSISTSGKGNPKKAAALIIEMAQNPPLRLPLGNFAIDAMKEKGQKLLDDAALHEDAGRNTDD